LFWYNKFWQDDGYGSQERRDEYRARGLSIMKTFHQDLFNNPWPNIYFLEKDFRFKFQDFLIKGKIDRVDKIADNSFEIIDYKTGESKNKLKTEDKRQLILYKVVAEASFGIKVDKLSYYYLEDGNTIKFYGSIIAPVYSFFEDHNGEIWLATPLGPGIADKEKQTFSFPWEPQFVNLFWEDDMHRLWMGLSEQQGLAVREDSLFWKYFSLPGSRSVTCMYSDPQGIWWLGTNAGIILFDPSSYSF